MQGRIIVLANPLQSLAHTSHGYCAPPTVASIGTEGLENAQERGWVDGKRQTLQKEKEKRGLRLRPGSQQKQVSKKSDNRQSFTPLLVQVAVYLPEKCCAGDWLSVCQHDG